MEQTFNRHVQKGCARLKEKLPHTLILVAVALAACAVITAYNAFYVPPTSLPQVIYTQQGTAPSGALESGTEGTQQIPSATQAQTQPNVAFYKININTANEQELQQLEGVGPVLARRIVEYREQNGSFQQLEELKNVKGIGDSIFAGLENDITI